VLTQGRIFRGNLLQMKYLAQQGPLRISAVVPKSTAKLATRRNSARRALYRAIVASPSTKKGGWAVIFLRRVPQSPMQPHLTSELEVLLKNLA